MKTLDTKIIATGGILLALSLVTLLGATFVPGIELTLYALSTVYVAIMIVEFSHFAGWIFYFASMMLAFILVPNKAGMIPYTIIFGIYAMIKYYIESCKKFPQWLEVVFKLVFCNVMLVLGLIFFGELFTGAIQVPELALPILLIGAQVFFLAYDYILTLVIGFYQKRRLKV